MVTVLHVILHVLHVPGLEVVKVVMGSFILRVHPVVTGSTEAVLHLFIMAFNIEPGLVKPAGGTGNRFHIDPQFTDNQTVHQVVQI